MINPSKRVINVQINSRNNSIMSVLDDLVNALIRLVT